MLKGNVVYGQSGGPTSVINASALGVFLESFRNKDVFEKVFAMHHGISGLIKDDLIDVSDIDESELMKLRNTAGAFFGTVRYKLTDASKGIKDYKKILATLEKHNIRYIFYNGGNDSMDTCNKLNEYLAKVGYECRVIGIPKTIDNDLVLTDHTPGFGSAAKFIANTTIEMNLDNLSYPSRKVIIAEVMGRNAGWLTASSSLASLKGYGPDLVYVPEVPFNMEEFIKDVKKIYEKKNNCFIAVSEGIVDKDGNFIFQVGRKSDSFGHVRLGGVGQILASNIEEELGLVCRTIEYSLLQRASCHIISAQDSYEAEECGRQAVINALKGATDKMVSIKRISTEPYQIEFELVDLICVANAEKKLPREFINEKGNNITKAYIDYILPLISGDKKDMFENGLIDVTNINKKKSDK